MKKRLISVVIPAHNEEENIAVIIGKIKNIFVDLSYDYEIIVVDDGGNDNTLSLVKTMAKTDSRIFYIEFSRNFGHQHALKAGLDHARGDCAISLDADMQHPPEMLTQMIRQWEEGYDIVYTIRKEDVKLSLAKRKSSSWFYKVLNALSDVKIEPGSADFRLMDRKVIEVFKRMNETDPFIRGLVKWLGFRQFAIDYAPNVRFAGKSKYSLKKMRALAIQGVTSFSTKPLHMAAYAGLFFSMASLLYVPYVLHAFITGREVSGWASLIVSVAFFGGLQLTILGIIGIYIGKMFMQTKNRPNYIVRSTNIKP